VADAGQFQPAIDAAAAKYGIDPAWLGRLLYQENRFQPTGTSPAGAQGIAQFMPGTAARYGVNVNDPGSSIEGAAHYLSDNLKMFGGNVGLATAAYNWGEGNVQKWMKQGGSVPKETQQYVSNITGAPITTWAGAGGAASRPALASAATPSAPTMPPPPDAYGYASSTPNALAGTPPIAAAPIASASPAPLGQGGIGSDYAASARNIPGTTINSNPIASLGGKIGDLATNLQKDLGKSDDDKAQPKPEIKPDIPPAPGARNISPLLGGPGGIGQGQVSPVFAQRMAALSQPMTWGSAPPGQMYGAGYGPQNQVYGTSLMSNLQQLDPTWMYQMAGG
jgi:hypothetical protein